MQIEVRVEGLEKVKEAFARFPEAVSKNFKTAGIEASNLILGTQGLRTYPPATAANAPPTPYYIRGVGTQYKSYNKGESERYGSQWHIEQRNTYDTVIWNTASYGKYLYTDKYQATHMAKIGWKNILKVGLEKLPEIKEIFTQAVKRTIEELGL